MHTKTLIALLLPVFSLLNLNFLRADNGGDCLEFEIIRPIESGADDVEERTDNSIYMNSSDIELIFDWDDGDQTVGLRFNDLDIPNGAEILEAWIQFTSDNEESTGTCNLQIWGEASDNALPFQFQNSNVSNRPRTDAEVSWSPGVWGVTGTAGPLQKTPNLTEIIQEVVNRPGWESGNSMAFLIEGQGRRVAAAYELNPDQAAVLHIRASVPIPDIQYQNVYINEIVPADGPLTDEFGEAEDWVEIYNGGDDPILLGGLYLTDDPADLKKWQISAPISIPAGGFGIIWADDDTEQGGNHANFKLKAGGEYLAISQELNGDLQILDEVQFPETPFKVSYGRESDGGDLWVFFGEVSHDESNNGKLKFLDSPVLFSQPGGFYTSLTLEMMTADPEADIFYTTDGSDPTPDDEQFTSPISVNSTQIIRAKAFKSGFLTPQITTEIYILNSNSTLPILSVQTEPENLWDDQNGIYVEGTNGIIEYCSSTPKNFNQDWERPGNIAFYEADGTKGFQVNVGVKIGGGCSRGFKAKGLNFFLRSGKYGDEKIDYEVFPGLDVDEFRRLKIRASGNDFEQMLFRDGINQTLLWNTVDLDLMAYRPVRVYLNGEYWGVYGLREFFNHDHIESHYGVDSDNLDFIINPTVPWHEVKDGDYDAMQLLLDYVSANNLNMPANYETVQNWVDIDEYINYLIAQIYYGNYDWPANNVRVWRDRDGGKFRWMLYDTDATTNYGWWSASNAWDNALAHAMNDDPDIGWPNGAESTLLFRKLMDNDDFEAEFVQRTLTFRELFFHPDRINLMTDSLQTILEPEMQMHMNKWNPPFPEFGFGTPSGGSLNSWKGFIDQYKSFFVNRRNFIFGHYRTVLGLDDLFDLTLNFDEKTPGKVVLHQNEMDLPFQFTATYFANLPMKIKAVAKPGFRFMHWLETGETNSEIEFVGTENSVLTPVFAPNTPIITEIHYHPQNDPDYEFIEWYNPTENTVDLSGYEFTEGIVFEFPQGTTLASGEYLLLVKDQTKFSAQSCQVLEWESGSLNNDGELIEVFDNQGITIQKINYQTSGDWPEAANGDGPSLALKRLYSDNSFGENWSAGDVGELSPCTETLTNDKEIQSDFSVRIFPNPAETELFVQYSGNHSENMILEIFNTVGQPIFEKKIDSNADFFETKINIQNWVRGIYFVRLKGAGVWKVMVE